LLLCLWRHSLYILVSTPASSRLRPPCPCGAEAFDLRDVRLLPGRVHDNLRRDSAWMARISVNRLVHSFRNNAGVFAGLEGGYESVRMYGGWESCRL